MGLTERLAAAAARRPHVLLVPVPGQRPLRWAAEDALADLGWPRASSPAGADLLLVCGNAGPALAAAVDVAWEGMPGPRARTAVGADERVRPALQAAVAQLQDVRAQREDADSRPAARLSAADASEDPPDEGAADDTGGTDTGSTEHSMDMDMGMDLPGGLVMADRMEDRDGLRLEGLNLSLGPLLPGWPAGLRLDVGLSGDVLTRADAVRLDPQPEPPAPDVHLALDALAQLLEAAGWSDGAARARRARREGGAGPAAVVAARAARARRRRPGGPPRPGRRGGAGRGRPAGRRRRRTGARGRRPRPRDGRARRRRARTAAAGGRACLTCCWRRSPCCSWAR